jgi:hypothetical protein
MTTERKDQPNFQTSNKTSQPKRTKLESLGTKDLETKSSKIWESKDIKLLLNK